VFLHIGGEVVVDLREVIAIVDAELENRPGPTRELLQLVRSEGKVLAAQGSACKSYVITDDYIYSSPISPATLRRRAGLPGELS